MHNRHLFHLTATVKNDNYQNKHKIHLLLTALSVVEGLPSVVAILRP